MDFCDDSELSYKKYKTQFDQGQGLTFDDAYRLAHLPLVAPDHPRVIATARGSKYNQGMHDLMYSIALPVPIDSLFASDTFAAFYDEIKATSFALKLSWDTFAQRKNKLHATICGAMSTEQKPDIAKRTYDELSAIGPVAISVRGLFSGNLNIGRLYLKVYPELRGGKNMCHEIQRIVGSPLTDLYVVGLLNFVEELDASETRELQQLLDKWWDLEFMQLQLEYLWLLKARDDLLLDGGIEQLIPLT